MGKFTGVLLATDLDGTLLNSQRRVSEQNLSAIAYFRSQGGIFTIATGRSIAGAQPVIAQLSQTLGSGALAPAILFNGAALYDYAAAQPLFVRHIGPEIRELAEEILRRWPNIGLEILQLDRKYAINRGLSIAAHLNFVQCTGQDIGHPGEVPGEWIKLLLCDLPRFLDPAAEALMREYGERFNICYSADSLLEIQDNGVDKGGGLRRLSDRLGIAPGHIYCAGDNENDLPMMEHDDFTALAPANAIERCRAAAEAVGPSNDEDFMAYVIGQLDARYNA